MKIKKAWTCIFFSVYCLFSLFSLDFGFSTRFLDLQSQTYKPSFGITFDIQEKLTDKVLVEARLLQTSKHNYSALTTANFDVSFFSFGAGIVYDIRDTIIAPGFIVNAKIRFKKENYLGLSYYASVTPENILETFSQNGKLSIHLKNDFSTFDSFYDLSYIKSEAIPYNLIFNSTTEIIGTNEKIPFGLGLFISFDTMYHTSKILNIDLSLRLGGKIILSIGKFGNYFFAYESNLFRLSEKIQEFPSSNIHLGAQFRINN